MKTVATVLAFVALLAGCEGNLKTMETWRQPLDRMTTVRVQIGDSGYASGVIIAPKRVLTAKHVAEAGDLMINDKPAKVLAMHEKSDVAVLEADVACPCAPIAKEVKIDEEVVLSGFPLQHMLDKLLVRFTGIFLGNVHEYFALFSGFAISGSSGGGIYNKKGEIVGIIDGIPSFSPFGPFAPPQLMVNLVISADLKCIKEIIEQAK